MGISWSKRRHHPPLPPPSSPSSNPPTPQLQQPPPPRRTSVPRPPLPPPAIQYPQLPPYSTSSDPPYFSPLLPNNYTYNNYNYSNYYCRPVHPSGQFSGYHPYYNVNPMPQAIGWGPGPSAAPVPPQQPAPYVDHKNAKKIKNDVNVHKDTIRVQLDELNPECHLVSFTFDALVDGSITIFYFAKEGTHCTFSPIYPEIVPIKIPFQKGVSQKFCQLSGTGIDLGFFDTDDLSMPVPGEDIYPLVISMESSGPPIVTMDKHPNDEMVNTRHAQITQAVLEKKESGNFEVKVIKQILWIDGARYELREIFGISSSDETSVSDMDSGKECVICMSEVKNTAVLPCRHMCMCSECAKELRLRSDKCPVCRQPIDELMEIKVDDQEAGI